MKASISFLYILTAALLFAACQPDGFKEIGNPLKPIENISGEWKLRKVTQTDINAEEKGFPYKSLDITDVLPFQDVTFALSFASGAPGNFSTTNAAGLDLFEFESGTWSVNDLNTPNVIYLIQNNDTATLSIGEYPTGVNAHTLKISITKVDEETDKALIRYDYEFVH